jgi:hypothetical protein
MDHHEARNVVPSGDDVWNGHLTTRDEVDLHIDLDVDQDIDASTAFWGGTRAWSDTGDEPSASRARAVTRAVPLVRRRSSDRTGPMRRTRTHRVTGGVAGRGSGHAIAHATPADDVAHHDLAHHDLAHHDLAHHDLAHHDVAHHDLAHHDLAHQDLTDRGLGVDVPLVDTTPGDRATWPVMHRLGLGHVDPLVVRIGVIVVIAVLLVPIALALRATAPEPSVTTDEVPAAGAAVSPSGVTVTDMPTSVGADVPAPVDSAAPAGEAPATVVDPSTLPPAPVINPDFGSAMGTGSAAGTTGTAAAPTDASGAVTESAPSTGPVSQAADVDEPAARVARSCPQRYTVVFGDSWYGLADRAAVALDELLRLNGATVDTPLHPGADVCLPARASVPAASPTAPPEPASATPPATPAPATTPPAYVRIDEQTAQAIIRDVWPDDLEERALAVAFRESRYDVTAKNYCCYGLFQIYWSVHRDWLGDLGITSAEHLFDARLNATAALELYTRSGGWGPWT